MAELLLASIVIVLLTSASAEYDVAKYCQLVRRDTKIPSLESCQKYYTCFDNMFLTFVCPGNTVFDRDAQSCVPESESNCYFGLANPCHNKHKQFSYNTNGCNWYNWCLNGEIAANGTCSPGQKFYAANSSCIYGDCDTSGNSQIQDMCDIMPEGEFFGDFENCRGWHKCVNTNQISGLCENSLVFDVASGYCLTNEKNMCQRTNNVIQGQASGPPEEPCTDVRQVVGDLNVCTLYYVCEIATQIPTVTYKWVQKNCKTQYFDVISKTCSGTLVARAYPGCDRCALKVGYSRTYWTNAVDPNCAQYFTCNNGQKVGNILKSCKEDYFFDEPAQACVGAEERLEQYIENNGACQDYTCNDSRECTLAAPEHGGTEQGGTEQGGTEQGNEVPPPPVNNGTKSEAENGGDQKPENQQQ